MATPKYYAIASSPQTTAMLHGQQVTFEATYASITAAQASLGTYNWVGNDENPVLVCINDFGGPLLDRCVMNGWTNTDATRHPLVTVADDSWHKGDVNAGFQIQSTANNCFFLYDYFDIERVRMKSVGIGFCIMVRNTCNSTLDSIVMTGTSGLILDATNSIAVDGVRLRSSIIHDITDRGTEDGIGVQGVVNDRASIVVENTVVVNVTGFGISNVVMNNNLVFNCSPDYIGSPDGCSDNTSGDGTAIGDNPITGKTSAMFQNYVGQDFSLSDGAEADDQRKSGLNLYSRFQTDIKGVDWTNNPFDRGAYKYGDAAPIQANKQTIMLGANF